MAAIVAAGATVAAQDPEEPARRRLESGRAFLLSQNYGEALKDFQIVLQAYPGSSVADDALLEVARYQLEVAGDYAAAAASADSLLARYPTSNSVPMALVVKGRVAIVNSATIEQVQAAKEALDRVPQLYAGTEAVPAAMYFAAEAARLAGRHAEAVERFDRVTLEYPRSPWAAPALLASARVLVEGGDAGSAMQHLQRVRHSFPDAPEASTALEWNTTLYRLYIRAPVQPAYVFGGSIRGPAGKLRDVADLAVDRRDHLLVATREGITTFDRKGERLGMTPAPEPRALFLDRNGAPLTLHDGGRLREAGNAGVVLSTTGPDGRVKPLRLEAGAVTTLGEVLVADRDSRAIYRFSAEGKPRGEFARQIVARRLAISPRDEVAALDPDARTVTLLARDGRVAARIQERGEGYQLRQPSDVAFDNLGHLYVLDRAAVLVFAPHGGRLLTSFAAPERSAGAFGSPEAMALDAAARLYIFDSRAGAVQVYQ